MGVLTAWWGPGGPSLRRGARGLIQGAVGAGQPARSSSPGASSPPAGLGIWAWLRPASPLLVAGDTVAAAVPLAAKPLTAARRSGRRPAYGGVHQHRDREREDDGPRGPAGQPPARRGRNSSCTPSAGAAQGVARGSTRPSRAVGGVVAAHAVPRPQPAGLTGCGHRGHHRHRPGRSHRRADAAVRRRCTRRDNTGVIAVAAASRPGQPRGRHHQPVAAGAGPHARGHADDRVARRRATPAADSARLVAVHRLVEDLAAGRVDLDEATARLRRIRRQKRPGRGGSCPWRTAALPRRSRCCSAPARPQSCSASCRR